MIWFTSDTHFGHRNILKYCSRPFKNVWEMNYQLIENWNSVVQPDDQVLHLGDFSFLPKKQAREILQCLNGEKTIVTGNHDSEMLEKDFSDLISFFPKATLQLYIMKNPSVRSLLDHVPGWPSRQDEFEIEVSHYPEAIEGNHDFHFCGHIHTQWRSWERTDGTIIYNVGVDEWDHHPINIEDIIEDMKKPKHRVTGDWKDKYHGK